MIDASDSHFAGPSWRLPRASPPRIACRQAPLHREVCTEKRFVYVSHIELTHQKIPEDTRKHQSRVLSTD